MTSLGGSTGRTVAILGARGWRRHPWRDVVARVGEEFFLDEELCGLSGSCVAPRSRVVGPILLVLEVKDCWGCPTVLPDSSVDVEHCFGRVICGVDVHSIHVNVGDGVVVSLHNSGTSFEVVRS
jgi:hypothetical protein